MTNKEIKRRIVNTVNKINGKPYKLGAMDLINGFDCFSYLWYFYREIGVKLPDHYNDLTVSNYVDCYKSNPIKTKKLYYDSLLSVGFVININYLLPGDLIVIDGDECLLTCIYIGKNNILSCDARIGVFVGPLKCISNIKCVRRLI